MSQELLVQRCRVAAAGLSIAALTCLVSVSSVAAADLSARRPVVVAPAPASAASFSWTGFYVGVQAGIGRTADHAVETYTADGSPTGLVYNFAQRGATFGGKIGGNYQYGMFVAGLEADLEAANLQGGFVDAPTGSGSDRVSMQGSVRARAGLAYDRLLVYGTGGLAFAQYETRYTFLPTSTNEYFKDTRTGWTIGGGADYAVTNNWIVGIDYRYADFGKINHVSNVAFPGLTGIHEQTSQVLHASVSYKF